MLLAAAERRLGGILGQRADDLVAAPDKDFALVAEEDQAPGIRWRQTPVATLCAGTGLLQPDIRSEEHTSELQSLMRISYAVFCLKKKKNIYISYLDYSKITTKSQYNTNKSIYH